MAHSPKVILEQTLFLWSVVHNTVLSYVDSAMIGRSVEPFTGDQYLDKEHFDIKLENGVWQVTGKETTNGTHINSTELKPEQKMELSTFDVLLGGDQIFVVLGRDLINISAREEFLKKIQLTGDEFAEQAKSIQNRSVAFFKLEYPNFVNLIKRTEIERKIEMALAKKAQDLKPFDERISQLQAKRQKIDQAWNDKINEFKAAIARIKDET